MPNHEKLHLLEHPLVQHKVSMLRDKNTGVKEFRELVNETATLIVYEALRDLPMKEVEIETPLSLAKTKVIANHRFAFVPIMRAGIGMADGALSLVPAAKIGHIGVFRDGNTHKPVEYYCKLPKDIATRDVLVADPMLATGETAAYTIAKLKEQGVTSIKFLCILASQQGIDFLMGRHPDVDLYCCAIDPEMDESCYILPGMGDAGDRMFGTK